MVLTGKAFEASTMILSFAVFCASYALIVWKDKSWINWATPIFFASLWSRYVFQFISICLSRPGGSHYAWVFLYVTYALMFLVTALVYTFIKPPHLKLSLPRDEEAVGWTWVWGLLSLGILFYLPILVQYRALLAQPRHIYEATRTGYGVWFIGSTFFLNLGFVLFLFVRRKTLAKTAIFLFLLALFTYWHGNKSPVIGYCMIWVMFRVYIERKAIRAWVSLTLLSTFGALVLLLFLLPSGGSNGVEMLTSVVSYADAVRNTMILIDDPDGQRYYGRLLLEGAIYPSIPRVLMPDKPKDFSGFRIVKIYNPANYRADQGSSAFDLGMEYADFGPFALVYLCLSSAVGAWLVSVAVAHLKRSPKLGGFIVLLYLSGQGVFSVNPPFFLPENLLLAAVLSFVIRLKILRIPSDSRRPEISVG
jgi:hypothetical protein